MNAWTQENIFCPTNSVFISNMKNVQHKVVHITYKSLCVRVYLVCESVVILDKTGTTD